MAKFEAADAALVRDSCVCLNVRRLARALTERYDRALEPAGLRMTQFATLAFIRAANALPVGELAAAMELDQTTMSRGLEVLRRKKLVSVRRSGRYRNVALTPGGESALHAAYPLWKAEHRRATSALGGERVWRDVNRRLEPLAGGSAN